jgi:hypothetical protein
VEPAALSRDSVESLARFNNLNSGVEGLADFATVGIRAFDGSRILVTDLTPACTTTASIHRTFDSAHRSAVGRNPRVETA